MFGSRKSSLLQLLDLLAARCVNMTEVKVCVSESGVFPLVIDGLFSVEHDTKYLPVEPKQSGLPFWNGNLSKTCTAEY